MFGIVRTKQFERSFKKLNRSGLLKTTTISNLETAIDTLAQGKRLPSDHQLKGELRAYRECHIQGDLLLVYQKHNDTLLLVLIDIGTHSYLFGS